MLKLTVKQQWNLFNLVLWIFTCIFILYTFVFNKHSSNTSIDTTLPILNDVSIHVWDEETRFSQIWTQINEHK